MAEIRRARIVPEQFHDLLPLGPGRVAKLVKGLGVEYIVTDSGAEDGSDMIGVMAQLEGRKVACFWRRPKPTSAWAADTGWIKPTGETIQVVGVTEAVKEIKRGT